MNILKQIWLDWYDLVALLKFQPSFSSFQMIEINICTEIFGHFWELVHEKLQSFRVTAESENFIYNLKKSLNLSGLYPIPFKR